MLPPEGQKAIPAIEQERLKQIKQATLKYLDELRERVGNNTKSPDPEAVILKYFKLSSAFNLRSDLEEKAVSLSLR